MIGEETGGDFYAQPLIGYRTWRMDPDTLDLQGIIMPYRWPADEDASAECRLKELLGNEKNPHVPAVVPVRDCNCGFYGYSSYPFLQSRAGWLGSPLRYVRGAVIGWGKAWTHERGWRAKHARPVALLHWSERRDSLLRPFEDRDVDKALEWTGICAQIAERYGIPVVLSQEELEQAARDYV